MLDKYCCTVVIRGNFRIMCGVGLVDSVLTDVLRDKVGVVVKIEI